MGTLSSSFKNSILKELSFRDMVNWRGIVLTAEFLGPVVAAGICAAGEVISSIIASSSNTVTIEKTTNVDGDRGNGDRPFLLYSIETPDGVKREVKFRDREAVDMFAKLQRKTGKSLRAGESF